MKDKAVTEVRITEGAYVDAETGEILERFQMREFWQWCPHGKRWVMVRHYRLDRERLLNPNREGL